MSQGLVLVIDDDEWVGRLLAVALRESGYEVVICASAVEGYEKAVESAPDCIICDVDLPDVDGFWVARKIRMASSGVSVTPFLFLSGLDDRDTRIQGFHVGADVYMTKPFRIDEVVAQVGALVQMVSRLRQSRKSFLSVPPTDAAMVGDLAQMSIATVLTLLDMERRSGKLEVTSKDQKATLVIVSGAITSAMQGGEKRDPLELLRALLTWKSGRFAFRPDEAESVAQQDNSINALLMEAVRLEDETRASLLDPHELGPGAGGAPRMPSFSNPPASDPMDSSRISSALADAFASSPPGPNIAELAPPVEIPKPPAMTPKAIPAPAIKEATPLPPSAGPKPLFGSKLPGPTSAAPLADRAPPLKSPLDRKPGAPAEAIPKPRPPVPRTPTPSPVAAVKPPAAFPPAAFPPAMPATSAPRPVVPPAVGTSAPPEPAEEDIGWSEPPPSLDPETDAASASPEKLRPPPAPTGVGGSSRPAAPRGAPVRGVPLPNPRFGQGSGEK